MTMSAEDPPRPTVGQAPSLGLTARILVVDDEPPIVGLAVGADDYLGKPFSPRELVARLKALLLRPRGGTASAARATCPPAS
jgi:DNA-binding response OmpR family regulator